MSAGIEEPRTVPARRSVERCRRHRCHCRRFVGRRLHCHCHRFAVRYRRHHRCHYARARLVTARSVTGTAGTLRGSMAGTEARDRPRDGRDLGTGRSCGVLAGGVDGGRVDAVRLERLPQERLGDGGGPVIHPLDVVHLGLKCGRTGYVLALADRAVRTSVLEGVQPILEFHQPPLAVGELLADDPGFRVAGSGLCDLDAEESGLDRAVDLGLLDANSAGEERPGSGAIVALSVAVSASVPAVFVAVSVLVPVALVAAPWSGCTAVGVGVSVHAAATGATTADATTTTSAISRVAVRVIMSCCTFQRSMYYYWS